MADHHSAPASALLRQRAEGEHSRVTFFELFFDLVFVFAVTQLSHALAGHLNFEGALRTLVLLLAIWWAWMYTTWATNWLDPEHTSVRLMLTAVMLAGLIMSAAIPEAFGDRGLVFATGYVAIQVGRSAFSAWAMRADERRKRTFIGITAWFAVSGVGWVAGGLLEGNARLAVWFGVLVFEYLGPSARYWVPRLGRSRVEDWNVEGAHIAERCGLFIIIALGESLLVTGATFSGLAWETALVVAMLASLGAAVAMWWVYFDVTAEAGSERIAHSANPGRLARLAYTYLHLPMVAGIILVAVGDEAVLAHPTHEAAGRVALVILGGPALFLLGHWLFKRAISGKWSFAHPLGIAASGAVLALYPWLSPVALSGIATLIVALVAIRGWWFHRHGDDLVEVS
jgi:low temperature requirement protein LtrA